MKLARHSTTTKGRISLTQKDESTPAGQSLFTHFTIDVCRSITRALTELSTQLNFPKLPELKGDLRSSREIPLDDTRLIPNEQFHGDCALKSALR